MLNKDTQQWMDALCSGKFIDFLENDKRKLNFNMFDISYELSREAELFVDLNGKLRRIDAKNARDALANELLYLKQKHSLAEAINYRKKIISLGWYPFKYSETIFGHYPPK